MVVAFLFVTYGWREGVDIMGLTSRQRDTAARRPTALGRVSAALRQPTGQAVFALGIVQIITWGTTVYALGVLGDPIIADTGWSRSLVFGGLTLGFLVSGVISAWTGRLIDRSGARNVMSLGIVMLTAGLVALAFASSPAVYLAAWALLGIAMRMTLYDAAFAALVQVTPANGRRAISYLTVLGGLASTLFWPIGHELAVDLGWRSTLLVYAAINLAICLPLCWWGLRRRETEADSDVVPAVPEPVSGRGPVSGSVSEPANPDERSAGPGAILLSGRDRRLAIILFGAAMSASGFLFGAASVHLVNLIAASGVGLGTAVFLASLKGLAQIAGRVWDIFFAKNLSPMTLSRVSVAFLPLSFLVLIFGGATFTAALLFTLAFGVGNGLITITRGAVPLQLFGAKGYGEVLGILATPYLLVGAIAPIILAMVIEFWGYHAAELVLLGIAVLACVAVEFMAQWIARRPSMSR